jgi:uncharacterized protein with von Willebrand factor type A (vWA) domain
MKTIDPVMQEVWQSKQMNAQKHQNLASYIAFLRKQSRLKHVAGRLPHAKRSNKQAGSSLA